jgi:hypothetical protein
MLTNSVNEHQPIGGMNKGFISFLIQLSSKVASAMLMTRSTTDLVNGL